MQASPFSNCRSADMKTKIFEFVFGTVLALGALGIAFLLFWLDRMRWCM